MMIYLNIREDTKTYYMTLYIHEKNSMTLTSIDLLGSTNIQPPIELEEDLVQSHQFAVQKAFLSDIQKDLDQDAIQVFK